MLSVVKNTGNPGGAQGRGSHSQETERLPGKKWHLRQALREGRISDEHREEGRLYIA